MRDNGSSTEELLDLLQDATSLDVVREFLRAKGLKISAGNWKDMRDVRLRPYIEDGSVSIAELAKLLSDAEECGDQHIFLYDCGQANAIELLDRARVNAAIARNGLEALLTEPQIKSMPPAPTIVDIRWETATADLSLTIKEVEVRTKRKPLREVTRNDKLFKIYQYEKVRAVNVAKLHRSGVLEVRIHSRDNTTRYDADLRRFFYQLQDFFPFVRFREVSLTTAKGEMWRRRDELTDLIRYTNASITDEQGNILSATTGSNKANLSQSNVGKSIDQLMEEDENAYCSQSNLWFKKSASLSTDVHVIMHGEVNELALTAKCSATDYKYVLDQIKHFNR